MIFEKLAIASKLLSNLVEKSLFLLADVVQQQFIGEMSKFIPFWRQVYSQILYQKLLKSVDL